MYRIRPYREALAITERRTGYSPLGASLNTALDLFPVIERICRSGKLQAADLVEFNPHYDRDGQGAKLAARLAWQIAHWWA